LKSRKDLFHQRGRRAVRVVDGEVVNFEGCNVCHLEQLSGGHGIGDILSPYNHGELAAAMVRPYVSERTRWILEHHCVFQGYHDNHHLGGDRNAREKYRDSPYYEDCRYFCHTYDQASFDPDYPSKPLEFFEPMLRRVFSSRKGHLELSERADD
jgi:predicted HD phosphohydrolase